MKKAITMAITILFVSITGLAGEQKHVTVTGSSPKVSQDTGQAGVSGKGRWDAGVEYQGTPGKYDIPVPTTAPSPRSSPYPNGSSGDSGCKCAGLPNCAC